MFKSGLTWKNGSHLWFATVINWNGRTVTRYGESQDEAIGKLESALFRIAGHRVYLFNF